MLFIAGEVTGGYLSGSLAVMSDAAHMAADLSTFVVSLWAVTLTTKGRDKYFLSFFLVNFDPPIPF